MVDFIKVALDYDTAKKLERNPRLEFWSEFSEQTSEVRHSKEATLENLTFEFKSESYCELRGSLHQFAHKGKNYTDFSFVELTDTLYRLRDEFGINLEQSRLQNLEVGVNIADLPLSPRKFERTLFMHKGEPFSRTKKYRGKVIGVECVHTQYRIKIYDKAKQCGLPYPLHRIEIHYNKMYVLNNKGITTLSDLLNSENLEKLTNDLSNKFDEVLMIEPELCLKVLNDKERRKLIHYENPLYWDQLSASNFKYHRRQYSALISKYVDNPLQQRVSKLLKGKAANLLLADRKILPELTEVQNANTTLNNTLYKGVLPYNRRDEDSTESNTLKKEIETGEGRPKATGKCKITGRDISDQRAGSKFVSAKKIGYEEAHQLRNLDSNPRNPLRYKVNRLEEEHTNALFPLEEVLRLTDKQKEMLLFWQGTPYEVRM